MARAKIVIISEICNLLDSETDEEKRAELLSAASEAAGDELAEEVDSLDMSDISNELLVAWETNPELKKALAKVFNDMADSVEKLGALFRELAQS